MSGTYRSKYEALVGALPEEDQRMLACRVARWALTETGTDDPRLWGAVDVAERYAHGNATQEELRAAEAAAADARDAARGTPGAARVAAEAAAADAAWAAWAAVGAARAAEDAARGAAWAARDARGARDDAWAAAYKLFFEWALELVIGEKVAA